MLGYCIVFCTIVYNGADDVMMMCTNSQRQRAKHQSREAPIRVCAEIQGGEGAQAKVAVPFGPGRRSGGAIISSVIHQNPAHGWARQQRGGYLNAHLPPYQSPCSRHYPYACHAPKGLGRGAPEGKGYVDDLSMLR